ncbi:universal stress protein [Humisphaera borealis]|uniref:Universal stress protein n=1 Tax=Humisphaera borealis TaxID=2807512 RepID=A0A7M2WZC5_9BACT|nr:universal stress protein [Humisphaera borealis]QOV90877.1 universal stress protein [Humisphaera borealis]
MSTQSLLAAVERYLEEEQTVLAASGEAGTKGVESRLAAARRALRREMESLSTWEHTPHAFSRVMVAVDDSKQAEWALELGVRIARTTGAAMAVVHVVPEPGSVSPELAYAEPALRAERRESAQRLLQEIVSRIPEGIKVTSVLHEGAASRHICAAAKDWEADVIVIGTHGRGLLGRLLLGGTAEMVVRHAHCPVLTVAHPPVPATQLSEEPAEHADAVAAAER